MSWGGGGADHKGRALVGHAELQPVSFGRGRLSPRTFSGCDVATFPSTAAAHQRPLSPLPPSAPPSTEKGPPLPRLLSLQRSHCSAIRHPAGLEGRGGQRERRTKTRTAAGPWEEDCPASRKPWGGGAAAHIPGKVAIREPRRRRRRGGGGGRRHTDGVCERDERGQQPTNQEEWGQGEGSEQEARLQET